MVFNVITFSLFWVVYRHNVLYVNKFRFDTGGLLFPTAVNQLFTGIYVMELALVGLFFLVRDEDGNVAAKTQAIIMIVVAAFTILYQWLLNDAFAPLFKYLPITLEDEAVIRDEEFARMQSKRFEDANPEVGEEPQSEAERGPESRSGRTPERSDEQADDTKNQLSPGTWAQRSRSRSRSRRRSQNRSGRTTASTQNEDGHEMQDLGANSLQPAGSDDSDHTLAQGSNTAAARSENDPNAPRKPSHNKAKEFLNPLKANLDPRLKSTSPDPERQKSITEYEYLFGGAHDEIEDLSPDERDALVARAFQHRAMRARRPVIWVPKDDLGVSDDEIRRTHKLTDYVWISNVGTALDAKGRCVFRRAPPDFSDIDLIEL